MRVAFVLYLLVGMWALLLYHLPPKRNQKSTPGENAADGHRSDFSSLFLTTNAMAIVALIVTTGFFTVMPRVGFGFFRSGRCAHSDVRLFRTGGLGVMGAIKQDPTLVMRVRLPEREPSPRSICTFAARPSIDTRGTRGRIPSRAAVSHRTDEGVFAVRRPDTQQERPAVLQDIL